MATDQVWHNSLIVRTDGTLAPCFAMYNATYDWGTIENHKFESKQLTEMKKSCQPHCFSTLNHILAYCYNDARVIKLMFRKALNRFREPLTSSNPERKNARDNLSRGY
jgi:hypothetical protein